ncbi:hypothetical protein [Streptomyces sp. NPDC059649]|uniref:hypothetical protein n=1 Tax=Streptomyces sp. NPDC059649 TaxID=3346895 RepID=UPI00368E857F
MAAVTTATRDEALVARTQASIAQYEADIAEIRASIASGIASGRLDKAEVFTLERIAAERQQRIEGLKSLT